MIPGLLTMIAWNHGLITWWQMLIVIIWCDTRTVIPIGHK